MASKRCGAGVILVHECVHRDVNVFVEGLIAFCVAIGHEILAVLAPNVPVVPGVRALWCLRHLCQLVLAPCNDLFK